MKNKKQLLSEEVKQLQKIAGIKEEGHTGSQYGFSEAVGVAPEKGKPYLVKGPLKNVIRVEETLGIIEFVLNKLANDPNKETRALAKRAMEALEDTITILDNL
jgi:hypothetical protein